jgi:hypothetical protein
VLFFALYLVADFVGVAGDHIDGLLRQCVIRSSCV